MGEHTLCIDGGRHAPAIAVLEVVLYIAVSLDGFIADEAGGVGWLAGDGSDPENPGSFFAFMETVDTVLLGRKTYEQIVTSLSPGVWPYPGKETFVFSRTARSDTPEAAFTREDPCALVRRLRDGSGKAIWVCGGAEIVNRLLEEDLIDRFWFTLVPVLLGRGRPLFAGGHGLLPLQYQTSQCCNGMLDIVYVRRRKEK